MARLDRLEISNLLQAGSTPVMRTKKNKKDMTPEQLRRMQTKLDKLSHQLSELLHEVNSYTIVKGKVAKKKK